MKLGISTYSLVGALQSGELSPTGVLEEAARIGAEHVEIVPIGYSLDDNPELVESLRTRAGELGLELSNYAVGANFHDVSDEELEAELARLRKQVDIAHSLGIRKMRHDVARASDTSMRAFMAALPRLADACRQIADYAAPLGITTSVENHGYFIQRSDRVQALIEAVQRDNFRMTLDVGNFLCADEDPLPAVQSSVGYASMVHIKDFYRRPASRNPGEGWFATSAGNWLRGAIVGHGDLDIPGTLQAIKSAGYDGFLSIEFEGMEECRKATRLCVDYVRRTWDEIGG